MNLRRRIERQSARGARSPYWQGPIDRTELLTAAGQAAAEQHSRAVVADLLRRGVEPRFLIQWFSLVEAFQLGDPMLTRFITLAVEGILRPRGLPLGALECCCCHCRWSAAAGPALVVRVELLGCPIEQPVVVVGLHCAGCYARIALHREKAEQALIEGWFPDVVAKSFTVGNEEPGPWQARH